MENTRTKEELISENEELKNILAFCFNQNLVKELACALNRINNGEFYTEKEFFKNSPLKFA